MNSRSSFAVSTSGPADWRLAVETNSGVAQSVGFPPDASPFFGGTGGLGSGQLAAGDHTTGTLCFSPNNDTASPPARYLLSLDAETPSFSGARSVWVTRRQ